MSFPIEKLGILTHNTLHILEGAAALIVVAQGIETRVGERQRIILSRKEAQTITGMLRQAGAMIDDLLVVVESRELALAGSDPQECEGRKRAVQRRRKR